MAYDLHAVWVMLRGFQSDGGNPSGDQKSLLPKKHLQRVLRLAEELGLLTKTGRGLKLSAEGERFAALDSWRLWSPKGSSRTQLAKHGLLTSLISEYKPRGAVLDLFSGVGGLGLGFEQAGFKVVAAVDNDPQACEAHKANFPHCEVIQGDISKMAKDVSGLRSIAARAGFSSYAGIVGGPPCQGFSYIGERFAWDERNDLTSRYVDIALALRPKFFLMENVEGLLSSGVRPALSQHLKRLSDPVGAPAAALAALLPDAKSAPSKRQRQFKKRAVSAFVQFVDNEISRLAEKQCRDMVAGFGPLDVWAWSKDKFRKACMGLGIEADESSWVRFERGARRHIHVIVLSAAARRLCYLGQTDESMLSFLEKGLSAGSSEVGRLILKEYKALKPYTVYRGVKVGPIAARLIERLGASYDVQAPKVLSAAWYGAPQDRRRVFIVGIRKDLGKSFEFPAPTHFIPGKKSDKGLIAAPTCFETIGDLPDIDKFESTNESDILPIEVCSRTKSEFARLLRGEEFEPDDNSLPSPNWNPYELSSCLRTVHAGHVLDRLRSTREGVLDKKSGKTRLKRDSVSHTLRAGTKGEKGSHTAVRPVHYEYNRVISVREGARLMGFPDWMKLHRTKWHGFRLVGNAVPAPLGRALASQISKHI